MVQILTTDQQKVLRAFGGWKLADLFIAPDRFTPMIGGSSDCNALGDPTHWLGFDGRGVRVGPLGNPLVEVRWSQAKAYAKTLDAGLRERLTENRAARSRHESSFRRWTPADGPVEDWIEAVEQPFYAVKTTLGQELDYLLDEALPLTDCLCRCRVILVPHAMVAGLCDA